MENKWRPKKITVNNINSTHTQNVGTKSTLNIINTTHTQNVGTKITGRKRKYCTYGNDISKLHNKQSCYQHVTSNSSLRGLVDKIHSAGGVS